VNPNPWLTGRRVVIGLAALLAAAAPALSSRQAPAREDSERFRAKVDAIVRHAETPAAAPLVTRVTEAELNAWLAYDGKVHLPVGLTEPRIIVLPSLDLSGTATVDLDAIKRQRQSRGWLDPLNYLGGTLTVAIVGRLDATDGQARFSLQSAKVGGVPVPKVVVQELVTHYSKTDANPRGINIDDPYPLPARIREIDIRPGEAFVKQ
jgi:hypothetical protein